MDKEKRCQKVWETGRWAASQWLPTGNVSCRISLIGISNGEMLTIILSCKPGTFFHEWCPQCHRNQPPQTLHRFQQTNQTQLIMHNSTMCCILCMWSTSWAVHTQSLGWKQQEMDTGVARLRNHENGKRFPSCHYIESTIGLSNNKVTVITINDMYSNNSPNQQKHAQCYCCPGTSHELVLIIVLTTWSCQLAAAKWPAQGSLHIPPAILTTPVGWLSGDSAKNGCPI